MAKILDLIYRVKDQASTPMKKIKGEQDKFNTSLKQGKEIATASIAAITGVAVATGKLINHYQDYTIAIGDAAHATGVTTEEMSGMFEMAGDLGIESESLTKAFKKMSKEGFDPSIEGLIQVRAKLDAARSDSERLTLAQQYLGKAGLDLLPIFDQLTNEQLRNYVDTMSEAQVVTEAEYQAAVESRKAIEEWKDSYEGLTLSIGGFLTKGLIPYLKVINQLNNPTWRRNFTLGMAEWWAKVLNLNDATKAHIQTLIAEEEQSGLLAERIDQTLIPTIDDYIEKLAEIPSSINTDLTISGGGGGNWGGTWGGTGTGGTGMPGTAGNEMDLDMIPYMASGGSRELTRLLRTLPTLIADAVERGRA